MVKKTYNITENIVKEEITLEVKEIRNAPLAEEERADTPDIDKEKNTKDSTDVKTKMFGTPGRKCYWVIAVVVALGCLALVLSLALASGFKADDVKKVLASSEGWKFEGMLKAYPRLEDNPADVSEIVICKKSMPELLTSTKALLNEYSTVNRTDIKLCSQGNSVIDGTACLFDVDELQRNTTCTSQNNFGLAGPGPIQPCFFLRIENSGDWNPGNVSDVTKDEDLKKIFNPEYIAVTCASKSQEAVEVQRTGEIMVKPVFGFSKNVYPQSKFNSSYYQPPLVIVQFLNPEVEVDIFAECQIRVKNSHLLQFGGKIGINFRILRESKEAPENSTTPSPSTAPSPSTTAQSITEDPVQGKNPDPIPGVVTSSNETTTEVLTAVNTTAQNINQTIPTVAQDGTTISSGNPSDVTTTNPTSPVLGNITDADAVPVNSTVATNTVSLNVTGAPNTVVTGAPNTVSLNVTGAPNTDSLNGTAAAGVVPQNVTVAETQSPFEVVPPVP